MKEAEEMGFEELESNILSVEKKIEDGDALLTELRETLKYLKDEHKMRPQSRFVIQKRKRSDGKSIVVVIYEYRMMGLNPHPFILCEFNEACSVDRAMHLAHVVRDALIADAIRDEEGPQDAA